MTVSNEITTILRRKLSHFELCANQDIEFQNKTTLLENVELVHQPLTEISLEEIDLSVEVLGKRLRYPLVITGMTGGVEEVGVFNRQRELRRGDGQTNAIHAHLNQIDAIGEAPR